MKVFLVFASCLLLTTGSNAFLTEVFKFLGTVGESVAEAVIPVAGDLFKAIENTGKQVLSQTIQDLLLHLGNLKSKTKRELNLEKAEAFVKGIGGFIAAKSGQFKEIFNAALSKLSTVENSVKSLDFLKQPITELVSKVEEAVTGHNEVADNLLSSIASEAVQFLKPLLGVQKRGILDSLGLNQIGQTLANLFKPHIDSLKTAVDSGIAVNLLANVLLNSCGLLSELVSSAGSTLKTHATNLLGAVKGSVNELGAKLSTHVDTLKTHLGTITSTAGEALATLKDAIGQVMQDTFSSLHNPITGIVNTLTNAAGTAVNHIVSKLNPTEAP